MRRRGIRFPVPNVQNHHNFLNLVDFKGIRRSNNPYTTEHTSAFDLKNLYLNDDLILTTRPRLEEKFSLTNITPKKILPINDNKMIIREDEEISIIENDGSVHPVDLQGYELGDDFDIFEKGDKIYVLDGKNIKEIDTSYVMSDLTNEYIPTRFIGTTDKVRGQELDELNLLSNKYREKIFWDGTWDYREGDDIVNIDEKWYNIKDITFGELNYNKLLFLNEKGVLYEKNNKYNVYLFDEDLSIEVDDLIFIGPSAFTNDNRVDVTDDFSRIVIQTNTQIKVFRRDGSSYINFQTIDSDIYVVEYSAGFSDETPLKTIKISKDGRLISVIEGIASVGDYEQNLKVYEFSPNNLQFTLRDDQDITNYFGFAKYPVRIEHLDENKIIFLQQMTYPGSPLIYYMTTLPYNNVAEEYLIPLENIPDYIVNIGEVDSAYPGHFQIRYNISENGNNIVFFNDFLSILGKSLGNSVEIRSIPTTPFTRVLIMNTGKSFIFSGADGYYFDFTGERDDFLIKLYSLGMGEAFNSPIEKNNKLFFIKNDGTLTKTTFNFRTNEENVIITKEISTTDKDYDTWSIRREKLLKSSKYFRFMNEDWYIYNNILFYTNLNTPLYVPLRNIIELGRENSKITGYNIVSDNILTIYSKEKLFLVTQQMFGDIVGYVYSETKSVAGNVPMWSPIVTRINELPLHINNDGIFRLSQTENISTSENITSSISMWIDPLLNDVDKSEVISLNYRYWTMFIFEKRKVFVLDNRNGEWFYWEYPVDILGGWTTDDGCILYGEDKIYTLETSEIVNKYNPNLKEYYDDGEVIIDWRWRSQHLHFGSINNKKQLHSTSFTFINKNDMRDEYGLTYRFFIYDRLLNEQEDDISLTGDIDTVSSITEKTFIGRYNFLQIELTNIQDDYSKNKLKLASLMFKFRVIGVEV